MRYKILLATAFLTGAVSTPAAAVVLSVSGFSGPWDIVGTTNPDYSIGDQIAPASLAVTAGQTYTIKYLSGLTGAFLNVPPQVDALGYVGSFFGSGLGESQTGSSGKFFASYLISGATGSPIYLNALIGDFVDSSGNVLSAFAPGNAAFTAIAPVGAVRLQLGINDDIFGDNSGALNVDVSAAVPEPASWALMIAGFGLSGAVMRRRRKGVRVSFA